MEDYREMFNFWRTAIAYLALLGAQLILLGVAVGSWELARKKREQRGPLDRSE